jgi:ubiquinone/menaquinone biosynthesis C-methylase UbiE
MALARVLEPEVMDSQEEAQDYDAMAHDEVNGRFVDELLLARPQAKRVLDVGTGTARIPILLCARLPHARVTAVDLSAPMLIVARGNVRAAGLAARVALVLGDATAIPVEDGAFDVVMSNSIVHHIPEPQRIFAELLRATAPGGLLFVRDLFRPSSDAEVRALVAKHAQIPGGLAPDVRAMHERQRDLFDASLRAGLTVDEVRATVAPLGVPAEATQATSDRHWTLSYAKPGRA